MKSSKTNGGSDSLSDTLREWKVDASLPPSFQARVWQRITRTEASRAGSRRLNWWQWFDALLERRSMAVSYVMLLLLVGVSVGAWQARHKAARMEGDLEARYLQTVDPYLASR